jgi:hypothetical protein
MCVRARVWGDVWGGFGQADEAGLDALDSSFRAISGGLAAFVKPAGFEK